uniref:Uncharacterized protein n=1 Tax=Phlebotomus papatasi TaxID=29031 RepID=A0A1B0DGQ3_PHLPP
MSFETAKKPQNSVSGKVLLAITGGLGVAITCISIPFVSPAFRKICLPYVPATPAQIRNVLSALHRADGVAKAPRNLLLDIGSGDGRIVIGKAILYGLKSFLWRIKKIIRALVNLGRNIRRSGRLQRFFGQKGSNY